MAEPLFEINDSCEVCKKEALVSKTGICRRCYEEILQAKADPYLKGERLRRLKQTENGVIRYARGIAAAQTTQREVKIVSSLEKRARQDEPDDIFRVQRVRELTPTELTELRPPETLNIEIAELNQELFNYLKKNSHKLYELSPRRFEELIAEILSDMGCAVELTPATRDGGRDILAWFATPFGRMLTIVECKRYNPNRKIGLEIVERFMWTIVGKDKASSGLIATTSFFSPDAKAVAKEHEYRLQLADFDQLKGWVGQYGKWTKTEEGSLWVPPV